MSKKSADIATFVEPFRGGNLDARYLAYFDCFNRQLFYEAHEVLEDLWLTDRDGPDGAFYKGLIQLAGAFVHLQKGRLQPSAALFKLAFSNLSRYKKSHHRLDLDILLRLIGSWQDYLASNPVRDCPFAGKAPPLLMLVAE